MKRTGKAGTKRTVTAPRKLHNPYAVRVLFDFDKTTRERWDYLARTPKHHGMTVTNLIKHAANEWLSSQT